MAGAFYWDPSQQSQQSNQHRHRQTDEESRHNRTHIQRLIGKSTTTTGTAPGLKHGA